MQTKLFKSTKEADDFLKSGSYSFCICFYGAEFDYKELYSKLKSLKIPFIGCMDIARLVDHQYYFEEDSLALMVFSKEMIESVKIISYDMRKNSSEELMYSSSKNYYSKGLEQSGIHPSSPHLEREFAINLLYGLQSANPILKAQNEVSLFLQTVGGSSGGKLDFIHSSVISSKGMGSIGATAIIKLNANYTFYTDRVSSFERMNEILKVTKLKNPRHILEFNQKPAAEEYARVVGKHILDLTPETFALYTLGVEPGDGEKLITSIMKTDGNTGLLTYNDLLEGTDLNLYKAILQKKDREIKLKEIQSMNPIGYISFDCVLCYLSRKANSEIDSIASLYSEYLKEVPQIGFGTFSENFCGANVNQTETFISFFKSS
jgi:hypothetical protein